MSRQGRLSLALVFAASLGLAACSQGWKGFERETLNPGAAKPGAPQPAQAWRESVRIPSQGRSLDAVQVRAPESCAGPKAALLIFHGRGETVGDWAAVQARLRADCVSSLVFDYTGHGASSPGGDIARLNADASAAAAYFTAAFADAPNRCLLSHSMGASPMLDMAARTPSVDCLIVASPFSSLKDMAVAGGLPRPVAWFLTNPWDNVQAASRTRARLLWVHSTDDATLPVAMGRRVYEAAAGPKSAATVSGFDHNAIYTRMPDEIWNPILAFLRAPRS